MKAIQVDPQTQALDWLDAPDPTPASDEVAIDIHATAVNRADLLQRSGNYPPPQGAPPYMGLEAAGVVSKLGDGVSEWRIGDRVCTLLSGGGYAEQVAAPAALLVRIPDEWSFEQAAAIPEVFYTAYLNLFIEGGLSKGETVLIHGGASGVGTAAIQLAKRAGCRVLITAGRADKIEACIALGAESGVNYKEENFESAIRKLAPEGVDVILDIAAAEYLKPNMNLLRTGGRLVMIALLTGSNTEIDLSILMRQRLRIIGSVLRSRALEEKVDVRNRFENRFWPDLLSGVLKPVIYKSLPIQQANAAQAILGANRNIGKVILKVRK